MPLSSAEAQKVIAAAHERAAALGIRIAVAIVDEGGLLQALLRMDHAMPLSAQVAESKANGAALTLRDGGALAQLAQERPGFFAVAGLRHAKALFGQILRERLADRALVIDQQQVRHISHAGGV